MNTIHIFAFAAHGDGISGGDRIFIEFARRWSEKNKVVIHVWKEGHEMCMRQNLRVHKNLEYRILPMEPWCNFGFFICYISRILKSFFYSLSVSRSQVNQNNTIIYSASEFLMDTIPSLVLKIRYQKLIWAATWYQTAPNPLVGYSEGGRKSRYRLNVLLYWISQLIIKPFISKFANVILVNNDDERKRFPNRKKDLHVVLGAVDVERIEKWLKKYRKNKKIYDAVFQGRFHAQKGVVELVDIWNKVVKKIPDAKLAMIGDGPLMSSVRNKIEESGLEKNIILFGYVYDGDRKYNIFSSSKIVVHPSFYDSGGMASAEAMAFGLACVGFDLKAYESYYPQGMKKVTVGDYCAFAKEIIALLKNKDKRERLGKLAQDNIWGNWSWDKRAMQTLQKFI